MRSFTLLAAALSVLIMVSFTACEKKAADKAGAPAATEASQGGINWMDYTAGMKKSQETGKPVMVDFYTSWCHFCKQLDETTYKDAGVVDVLNKDFVAIKINAEGASKLTDEGKEITEADLAKKMQVTGYPTIWFFDSKGMKIAPLAGYSPASDFKPILTYISSGSYAKGVKFQDYVKTLQK